MFIFPKHASSTHKLSFLLMIVAGSTDSVLTTVEILTETMDTEMVLTSENPPSFDELHVLCISVIIEASLSNNGYIVFNSLNNALFCQ